MTVSAEERDRWVRRFRVCPESRVRLVCFPHAGGSASYYFPMAQGLAPGVEVLAVQYPGRQDRRQEPHIETITELADRVHEALGGWTDRPYAFFGHSMGAVLAYEVASRCERQGGAPPPVWLFASGRSAPSRDVRGDVHRRDDEGILAELLRVGGTDRRLLDDEELKAAVLTATRNDYRAIETYTHTPGTTLSCPVTALVGDTDPKVGTDDADAWREHTTSPFALRVLPGGHFYLSEQWPEVTATVTAALRQTFPAWEFEGSSS